MIVAINTSTAMCNYLNAMINVKDPAGRPFNAIIATHDGSCFPTVPVGSVVFWRYRGKLNIINSPQIQVLHVTYFDIR